MLRQYLSNVRVSPSIGVNVFASNAVFIPLARYAKKTTASENRTTIEQSMQPATKRSSRDSRSLPSLHFRATSNPHPLFKKPEKVQAETKKLMSDDKIDLRVEAPFEHPVWSDKELLGVELNHHEPQNMPERLAYATVTVMRSVFDFFSGYTFGRLTRRRMLARILILETVAGVPGFVAASLRHLRSLRRVREDHGWIATLLEEASNERMHLLVFAQARFGHVGRLSFRLIVLLGQGVLWNFLFFAYLISPRYCHSFVSYLEEEATVTYTHILHVIDSNEEPELTLWASQKAPQLAIDYWRMKKDATWRDVVLQVRADESNHRDTNRVLAALDADDENPTI